MLTLINKIINVKEECRGKYVYNNSLRQLKKKKKKL